MWISRKEWEALRVRVSALENLVGGDDGPVVSRIYGSNIRQVLTALREYLDLELRYEFGIPPRLKAVKRAKEPKKAR